MIGQDFPKIEWHFLGLDLLEPNAIIGDIILFSISLLIASTLQIRSDSHPFYSYWRKFFLWFGWGFLFGGFGHLLYNYLGLWGKYPAWLMGMVGTYFLSLAQISLWPNERQKNIFRWSATLILFLGIIIEIMVFNLVNLSFDQSKGLVLPSLISGIYMLFSLVYMGIYYQKYYHSNFKFFWMAVLMLLPSALIQNQKINLHQWFDRNDFSHILLAFTLLLYWKGISAYQDKKYVKNA
jgi:hypothetical protein